MIAPLTVKPPACAVVPTTRVPAVIAASSVPEIENVPPMPDPPTAIDLAPFGRSETVPEPALMVPVPSVTVLAVIAIAALVEEIELEFDTIRSPVPSVVMVTPFVPATEPLLLIVMFPLEVEPVCRTTVLPDTGLPTIILPRFDVSVNVPEVDVRAPFTPIILEAPVVVTVKVPPTVELIKVRLKALVINAEPVPPVFTDLSPV